MTAHLVVRRACCLSFAVLLAAGAASGVTLEEAPEAWFGESDTRSIGLTSDLEVRLALASPREQTASSPLPLDEPGYAVAAFPRIGGSDDDGLAELAEMTPPVPWDLQAPDFDYRTDADWFADWYGDADLDY